MNKQGSSSKHFVLLAIFFCIATSVLAHRPIFSDLAANDPNTAVWVDRPDVSQVIYRPLDADHRQVWLAFKARAGFDLFVQLGVPVLDRLMDYRPSMAVIGPGLEQAEVPFDVPAGMGVAVFATDTVESPRFFHEHFTKTDSRILRSETLTLPKDGTYYLVAFEPNNQPGKLWLALGTKERFGFADLFQFGAWRKTVQSFHEVGQDPPQPSIPHIPTPDLSALSIYEVTRIIDGDTIIVTDNILVRLIGVDTPETAHPRKPVEEYGKEASLFLTNLLKGEQVYLVGEDGALQKDRYGRTLAYVYRYPDGLFVNAEIIRQGYGHAYIEYPFVYMDEFLQLERFARQAEKGLWSERDQEAGTAETVYITPAGRKYHKPSCPHVRDSGAPIQLSQAKERCYEPCQSCYMGNPTIIDPNSRH